MTNKNNPRKPILLSAGTLEPLPNSNNTKSLTTCNNTVIQSDITPKTSVEVSLQILQDFFSSSQAAVSFSAELSSSSLGVL